MGLFDQLSGMLESGGEGQSGNIVGALLSGAGGAAPGGGGLGGVLETLCANGFAQHVESWTAGEHLPISPQELESALGSAQVQQMAQASGLPVGDFLQHLAQHLPAAAAATSGN
ncbi:MAG TPA: YidB family protein [Caulobacteraceae bacterium]